MKWKDATRDFGNVGILISVLLIFLISAGATIACPDHAKVMTRTVSYRTMPSMRTTLITYGGPAVPCGQSASYGTRKVKYVAVRDSGYYTAPQYVAYSSPR